MVRSKRRTTCSRPACHSTTLLSGQGHRLRGSGEESSNVRGLSEARTSLPRTHARIKIHSSTCTSVSTRTRGARRALDPPSSTHSCTSNQQRLQEEAMVKDNRPPPAPPRTHHHLVHHTTFDSLSVMHKMQAHMAITAVHVSTHHHKKKDGGLVRGVLCCVGRRCVADESFRARLWHTARNANLMQAAALFQN